MPEEVNDENVSEKEFIESILDHCTYSSLKNIKDEETKKKIVFKNFGKCKIKFLNTKNMENLTLEKFIELENKEKIKKNKADKTSKKKEKIKINENFATFFIWEKLPYLIISNINMNTKNSGVININFYETEDQCVGTIALNNKNEGSWSISCPDNSARIGIFKTKLSASGTISLESNKLKGIGYDAYQNRVKFISELKKTNE